MNIINSLYKHGMSLLIIGALTAALLLSLLGCAPEELLITQGKAEAELVRFQDQMTDAQGNIAATLLGVEGLVTDINTTVDAWQDGASTTVDVVLQGLMALTVFGGGGASVVGVNKFRNRKKTLGPVVNRTGPTFGPPGE